LPRSRRRRGRPLRRCPRRGEYPEHCADEQANCRIPRSHQGGLRRSQQAGGIIQNAQRPEEHYHNARLYEQRGDFGNARRSYNALFAYKLDFLDPHLRYQTFLKIQEGRTGAREIYNAIYEQDKRPLIDFARILLLEAPHGEF